MHNALMVLLLIISVAMILTILGQTSKSDGLSGAISGGAEQLFGKKKGNSYDAILSRITTVLAALYIILSLLIVAIFN